MVTVGAALATQEWCLPKDTNRYLRLALPNATYNASCGSQQDNNTMIKVRWLLAIPVILAATLVAVPGTARAANIRDRGGMFSSEAVEKAQAVLDKAQRSSGVPIVIETIDAIPGLDRNASAEKRRRAIDSLAVERDKAIHDEGIYVLLSKHDHVISHVLVRERLTDVLPIGKRDAIRDAFVAEFKKEKAGAFDAGLLSGARAIEKALEGVSVHGAAVAHRGTVERVQHRADGGRVPAGRSTLGTFLMIILGIFGVLLVLRLIGGLFNRSPGQGYAGGLGQPGGGMGGPGYYGGGYGGRGGGFFSSMLGGIGGALAGNWLYDQFSGRHGQYGSADAGYTPDSTGVPDQGGDAIVGADDDPGGGTSWDPGGGGDAGGGGDWGGGGGDWGGGGGDWGGGGGGDW